MDHYETLGVYKGSTQEEVKRAFRSLVLKIHPDKEKNLLNKGEHLNENSNKDFDRVVEAYNVLRDCEARKKYDLDRELARRREIGIVTEEVDLDDMSYDEESGSFSHPCRCSGTFLVTEEELEMGNEIYPCNLCSLKIHVLYDINDEV